MSGCGRTRAFAARLVVAAPMLSVPPAGAEPLQEMVDACLGCHGAKGQSAAAGVPSLGGQPVFYLTIQLMMFREKLRAVEPMTQMLGGLKDDDLRALADYISKLPPPEPGAGSADADRMLRARALIEQHRCNFCHSADFAGAENVPRLAGQREDYLVKALRDYKNNSGRGYDASMADVLYPLGDDQLADLAYFLSRLR